MFEETSKHALALYNIGTDENTKMEQYECLGKDTGQVVNDLVSQLFKSMNIESRLLGMECFKDKNRSLQQSFFKTSRFDSKRRLRRYPLSFYLFFLKEYIIYKKIAVFD